MSSRFCIRYSTTFTMIAKGCVRTFHAVKLALTLLAVTKKDKSTSMQKNFVQRSHAASHKSTASIKLIHAHIAPKFDFTAYFTTEMGLAFGTKACCCFPRNVLFGDSIHKKQSCNPCKLVAVLSLDWKWPPSKQTKSHL